MELAYHEFFAFSRNYIAFLTNGDPRALRGRRSHGKATDCLSQERALAMTASCCSHCKSDPLSTPSAPRRDCNYVFCRSREADNRVFTIAKAQIRGSGRNCVLALSCVSRGGKKTLPGKKRTSLYRTVVVNSPVHIGAASDTVERIFNFSATASHSEVECRFARAR